MKMIQSMIVPMVLSVSMAFSVSASEKAIEIQSGVTQKSLVELYTSQGCSSCPPAEKFVSQLKNDERLWNDLIPVAFHVDYWDYIGWKDPFAEKEFSTRQRQYAKHGNVSNVYTPGFVVNGEEWRGFFARKPVHPTPVKEVGKLTAVIKGDAIDANFSPIGEIIDTSSLVLNIAVLGFGIDNHIPRGENKGLSVSSDFVVIGFKQETINASDKGDFLANTTLPMLSSDAPQKGIAVWVSEKSNNRPIQALGGWL